MLNNKLLSELNITMSIVARPYLDTISPTENALRRVLGVINDDTYNHSNNDELSSLANEIQNYLHYEYSLDKLTSIINIFDKYHLIIDKVRYAGFNTSDVLITNLTNVLLIDKLILDLDKVLNLSRRDISTDVNKSNDYTLYQSTLISLLCNYMDKGNLDEFNFLLDALTDFISGNSERLLEIRNQSLDFIRNNILNYNKLGEGCLSEENISLINKLCSRLVKDDSDFYIYNETKDEQVSKEWLDYTITNHSGYDELRNTFAFILNMIKYKLTYLK